MKHCMTVHVPSTSGSLFYAPENAVFLGVMQESASQVLLIYELASGESVQYVLYEVFWGMHLHMQDDAKFLGTARQFDCAALEPVFVRRSG